MRRKLFNLFAALSLLLFLAVCVLWVRSWWAQESWGVFVGHLDDVDPAAADVPWWGSCVAVTADGQLRVAWNSQPVSREVARTPLAGVYWRSFVFVEDLRCGFLRRGSGFDIVIPAWLATIVPAW